MTDHIMTYQGPAGAGQLWHCDICGRMFALITVEGRRLRVDITPGDTSVYHVCAQGVPGAAEPFVNVDDGPALPDDLQDQIDELLGGVDL